MATLRKSILGAGLNLDTSGDIFPSSIDAQLTMTNAKKQNCIVMQYPTGSDIGFYGTFKIPKNYVGSPKIIITGIIDGTPASTFGVGFQKLARAISESVDVAYDAEQLASNATWTGYVNEDQYVIEITLTAGDYVVDDQVYFWFFRDDNVDTTTWAFLLTELEFEWADA